MAAATAHAPMVTHGLRALASPMRRMTRCITVLLSVSGSDGGGAGGGAVVQRWAPAPARSPVRGRVGPPPRGGLCGAVGRWIPPVGRSPTPPGGG
jgi:hypothetical protein